MICSVWYHCGLSGYGEVSVDTDVGKVFAVVFALVGIPLMFITAADIGKFLSETLLKFVSNWNRMTPKILLEGSMFVSYKFSGRP
ncbi:unnamed protein product [Strongylus vulgaris]|uniref:Potassium channel domain-containing protein n=1 Tax=Strongylus vulgaris TaxID=40348 RepID=A0A3P7JDG0_STRVU|nr:unnamed protein product [Strongylus vulgaris]